MGGMAVEGWVMEKENRGWMVGVGEMSDVSLSHFCKNGRWVIGGGGGWWE